MTSLKGLGPQGNSRPEIGNRWDNRQGSSLWPGTPKASGLQARQLKLRTQKQGWRLTGEIKQNKLGIWGYMPVILVLVLEGRDRKITNLSSAWAIKSIKLVRFYLKNKK